MRATMRSLMPLACAASLLVLAILSGTPQRAAAQGSVSSGQIRPFVTGWIPVVGPGGAVGGVSIDADGVVARCGEEAAGRLREARLKALAALDEDLNAKSPMRKVSLRGLIAAIEQSRKQQRPLLGAEQNLAGLQRIEYVLLYPERQDIVLAGPAEGWTVDREGRVIGRTSGEAVLQLDDLIVALRAVRDQQQTRQPITCSIDPTKDGLMRFTRLVKSRDLTQDANATALLEEAVGPQTVSLTGIPPTSRFAQVLLAADFAMKRIAMNLEPSPVDGLPGYLTMLEDPAAPMPRNSTPRWWMAPRYEPLLKDADGLAWQLRGQGVQTVAEDGVLRRGGAILARPKGKPSLPDKWAELMTARFEDLAKAAPIFGELRGCMDMAVVATLLERERLADRAGCDLSPLFDRKRIAVAEYYAPKTIDSRASLMRKEGKTVVSVSGGVDLDAWSVCDQIEVNDKLAASREDAAHKADRWWWD